MPTGRLITVLAAAAALVAALVAIGAAFALRDGEGTCGERYADEARVGIGTTVLEAELAHSPAERERGLSGRACIGDSQAMLFDFDRPGQYSFWMKGMRFAIDIVWLDADRRVVKLQPNVAASSPNDFTNSRPARYVLELAAGQAEALDLRVGTQLALAI